MKSEYKGMLPRRKTPVLYYRRGELPKVVAGK
jgi:hypothetical protein